MSYPCLKLGMWKFRWGEREGERVYSCGQTRIYCMIAESHTLNWITSWNVFSSDMDPCPFGQTASKVYCMECDWESFVVGEATDMWKSWQGHWRHLAVHDWLAMSNWPFQCASLKGLPLVVLSIFGTIVSSSLCLHTTFAVLRERNFRGSYFHWFHTFEFMPLYIWRVGMKLGAFWRVPMHHGRCTHAWRDDYMWRIIN